MGVDEEEKKTGQAVPSRLSFDGFLKATNTNVEAEDDYLKGRRAVDEACLGGGSGNGSGSDGGVVVGSVGLADDAEVVVKRETMDVMQIMPHVKEEVETESCIGCSNGDKKRKKKIDEGLAMDVKVVMKKEDGDSVRPLPQVKKEVKIAVESSISFLIGDERCEDTGCGDGVIDTMPIDWAKPVVKQEREELKPRSIDQKARIPKKMGVEESNRKVMSREEVEDGDFAVEPDWSWLVDQ